MFHRKYNTGFKNRLNIPNLKQKLWIVLILSSLLFLPPAFAHASGTKGSVAPEWSGVLETFQNKAFKKVIKDLAPVLQSKVALVDSEYMKRAWMLTGKSQLELKQYAPAQQAFKRGSALDQKNPDIWLYQKIRLHLESGKKEAAIRLLKKMLASPRYPLYAQRIRADLKKHYQTDAEITLLLPLLKKSAAYPHRLLYDYDIIGLYLKGLQQTKAKRPIWLYTLQWQYPKDLASAKLSEEQMLYLLKKGKKLTSKEILQRVQTLRKLGLVSYSIKHLPEVAKRTDDKTQIKLGNQYARTLFQKRFYSKILKLKNKGVFTRSFHMPESEQLYWGIRAHQKLKHFKSAKRDIRKLTLVNIDSQRLPRVYKEMAIAYQLKEKENFASIWWDRLLTWYPQHKYAKVAAWELAWFYHRQNDPKKALRYLSKGLKIKKMTPEVRAKFTYWKGKLLYAQGKETAAKKSFKHLVTWYPNTYYGLLLTQRNDELGKFSIPKAASTPSKFWHDHPPHPSKKEQKLLRRAEFLLAVEEPEQAVREMQKTVSSGESRAVVWEVSKLMKQYHQYTPLQSLVLRYYTWDMKRLAVKDQHVWKFAFPRPYWDHLKKYAEQSGIDPYLALSVIREESLFNPQAISSTRAIGLMQLMPKTAKQVARGVNVPLKSKADIFDPLVNTLLGTHYLGRLSRSFQEELIYTVGSYNAGPGNMGKWVNHWEKYPIDEFVEHIPFMETQNYVKRVFRTYQLYKRIYHS